MANEFLDLLNQAATNPRIGNTPETKQANVAATSQRKQQEIANPDFYQHAATMDSELGANNLTDIEFDVRYNSPTGIMRRYGNDTAFDILTQRANAQNQVAQDQSARYESAGEVLGDAVSNIGLGILNTFGGIAAFTGGRINDNTGALISRGLQATNKAVEGVQSERLQAGRSLTEARFRAADSDNALRYEQDKERGYGDFHAAIRQIGREALSGIDIATDDSAYLGSGTAQGIGSIIGGIPIARGISKASSALLPNATQRGIGLAAQLDRGTGSLSAARALDRTARSLPMPLAIGAMEGGGAYTDVSNQIQEMSFEELEQTSPNYRALIEENVSPEEARLYLANKAGTRAAVNTAPIAAATGTIASRFEGNPLQSRSVREALTNIAILEPTEEAFQGAISGIAGNKAIQEYADETRDLTENVGRQVGEGATFGLTAAGALQGPSLSVNAVRDVLSSEKGQVATNSIREFTGSIVERADRLNQANEEASPVADSKVAEAATVASDNLATADTEIRTAIDETDSSPEEKQVANSYVDNLLGSLTFDPAPLQDEAVPNHIRLAVGQTTNRVEAIQNLAASIENAQSEQERLDLGLALLDTIEPVMEISQSDPSVFDSLPDDHPAVETMLTYKTLMANVLRSPKVNSALEAADNLMLQMQENSTLDINEQTVATPEGQQQVQVAVSIAERNPDKANLETSEKILFQADQGRLELAPKQRTALETSVNLLRSARVYQEQAAALGHPTTSDIVSREITTDRVNGESLKQSALGFTQQVVGAMRQNDPTVAQARLEEFGLFVQHMQNKVNAYNENFASGNPNQNTKYQALMPDRTWKESAKGVFVHPSKANSLRLAQTVNLEAQLLNDVYTGLQEAFPELASQVVTPISLDQALVGNPTELANRFSQPAQTPQATQTEEAAPVQPSVEEAPAPTSVQPEPTSTVPSVESIQALSDAVLNEQLESIQTLNQGNNSTPFTREYFNRLDAELTRREDAAVQEAQQAEEAESAVGSTVDNSTTEAAPVESNTSDATVELVPVTNTFYGVKNNKGEDVGEIDIVDYGDYLMLTPQLEKGKGYGQAAYLAAQDLFPGRDIRSSDELSSDGKALWNRLVDRGLAREEQVDVWGDGTPVYGYVMPARTKQSTTAATSPAETASVAATEPVSQAAPVTETVTNESGELNQYDTNYTNLVNREADLLAQLEDEQLTDSEASSIRSELESVRQELRNSEAGVEESILPRTMNSYFPSLVENGEMTNMFKKAFTVPKQPRTRTSPNVDAIQTVTEAVTSPNAMAALAGERAANRLTPTIAREYANYMSGIPMLRDAITARLTADLNRKDGQRLNALQKGEARAARYADTKLLNIVEPTEDGFGYNQSLLDNAMLASMQWLLESDKYGSTVTDEDIANITGRDPVLVQPHIIEALQDGSMSAADIKRSMGDKINKYWGLQANHNESLSYTQGIPEDMAAEIIESMIDLGLVEVTTIDLSENQDGTKTMNRYKPAKAPDDSPLLSYPTAIENAVMIDPEEVHYIGNDVTIPVARTQMRNRLVNNTKQQREAIEAKQQVPFYIDTTMLNLVTSLGQGNLVELFGAGSLTDERKINKIHAKTLEGQNRTLTSAIEATNSMIAEVKQQAELANTSLNEMPIRYAFNFSSVGRLHMLGKHNPQASKYTRELILPNQATIDLGSDEGTRQFGLGVAQALGIKVHNMPWETVQQKLQGKLDNELVPAIDVLSNWLDNSDTSQVDNVFTLPPQDVATLKNSLEAGGAKSMAGLHALIEYVRSTRAEDPSQFETSLYLEADGVTNGVMNALILLVSGVFTKNWKDNVARGGLYFNSERSLNEHRSEHDSNDLYNVSSDYFSEALRRQEQNHSNHPQIAPQINHVMNVMETLLKDITLDDDGNLVLDRGVTKNPLTITLYGSGAAGIAGNFVDALTEVLYERMTEAANSNASSVAEALFPDAADPQARYDAFNESLHELINKKAVVVDKELLISRNGSSTKQLDNYVNFEFTSDELSNLQTNLQQLFVVPLREAITQTVGSELMNNAELLRISSQVQSIYESQQFQKAITDKRAELEDSGERVKSEYLSRNELDDISKSLRNVAPVINTGSQILNISGSSKAEDPAYNNFSSSLSGSLRTGPFINGPTDAGVRGIPMTVIGQGDGMMMQYITLEKLEGTLEIFDGMHMPLDKIDEYSRTANEAVYKTWQGNPLRALQRSYESFLENADLTTLSQAEMDQIAKAMLGDRGIGISQANLVSLVQSLLPRLKDAADSIEARHKTTDSLKVSVDQMAAAASPYITENDSFDSSITDGELLTEMNRRYVENLATLRNQESAAQIDPVRVGAQTTSGATLMSGKAFRRLGRMKALTPEQSALHREVVRSGVMNDYQVVMGTPQQIQDYQESVGGIELTANQMNRNNVQGFITPANQTVYISNGSVETILHELVHASTFNTVNAYYQGQDLGTNSKEIGEAIQRIEALRDQFNELSIADMTDSQREAYLSTVAAMDSASSNLDISRESSDAIALNEFMAWALSNADLAGLLKKTKAPYIVRLARDVVEGIKQLFWGNKKAPDTANSMFDSLRFNAAIVMAAQPSMAQVSRNTMLFQSQNYGTSDRLTEINNTFNKKITDYLDSRTGLDSSRAIQDKRNAVITAIELSKRVQAAGYPMSMQEKTTFEKIVAALTMQTELDSNVMIEAQKLYAHAIKEMNTSFLADPRFAQDIRLDQSDRSTLLPVFLALSMTNDKFRGELSRVALPKAQRKSNDSLDNVASNAAQAAMDKLSTTLAGQNKSSDVRAAVDALSDQLNNSVVDRDTLIDQFGQGTTSLIDRSNQIVVDSMTALAERANKYSKGVQANPDANKYEQAIARSAQLITSLANQEQADAVSEGIIAQVNETEGLDPLRAILSDITGRTESNAQVYDLIKPVRAQIQRIRQNFRKDVPVIIANKFKQEPTKEQWAMMTRGMGNTDLAALVDTFSRREVLELLGDTDTRQTAIESLQAAINTADPSNAQRIDEKAKQLAHYMNTGEAGRNLLRNSDAIANLLNERTSTPATATPDVVRAVDQLTSLYAIEGLAQTDKDSLALLAQAEPEGMDFTLAYLVGQRKDELAKSRTGRARFNHYKGYIRANPQDAVSMMVADDTQYSRLIGQGYERVADYVGSSSERSTVDRGYYYLPVASRAAFSQGLFQNAHKTAYGVNAKTGYSENMTAGVITDKAAVRRITQRLASEKATNESLMPIFDETGAVVAYERAVDASITRPALNQETNLGTLIGEWRGRQVEEAKAQIFNEVTVDRLKGMYDEHSKSGRSPDEYVDLFDQAYLDKNPIIADAVSLLNGDTLDYIQEVFGDNFYVRKDMLKDAIGYRSASIGDAWTGNTNWSPEVQKTVRNLAVTAFGNKAYRYLVNAESVLENVMGEVRTTIVVRSVIIPVVNFMSNVFHLISAGVPTQRVIKELPKKLAEIHNYTESYARMTEAQAELLAASENPAQARKLEAEIQSIEDSHRRMSIWPLLEAGEFSTVTDIGRVVEGTSLTSGRLGEYMENLADKLPPVARTAARYGLVGKDTALYQGLQKSVLYGDFISKAVLYDDLVKRQRKSKEEALAQITEEFVNYDVLPGRFRGKLENVGLLWFYNFKVRSAKVAAARMRNNPVHTLMAMTLPGRNIFGDAGLPIEDNVFSKAAEGTLGYSIGPGMAGSAIGLNPWINLSQ